MSSARVFILLARLGYAAKGVVYGLVGILAALAAIGARRAAAGSREAMERVASEPFGSAVLVAIAAGLACHALWLAYQATGDPESSCSGTHMRGVAKRISLGTRAFVYGGLTVAAVRILIHVNVVASGISEANDDANAQEWSAKVMAYPAGRFVVAAIGLIILGNGLAQVRRASRHSLDRRLCLDDRLSRGATWWLTSISRFGIAARAVVLVVVGFFFCEAAYNQNARQARGLGGALQSLAEHRYGSVLLAVVSVGLIAFGVFEILRARYRRIDIAEVGGLPDDEIVPETAASAPLRLPSPDFLNDVRPVVVTGDVSRSHELHPRRAH